MTNAGLADGYGLIFVLFMGGLMGSFAHCAAMCGPFVIGQNADELKTASPLVRLAGRGRLFYHLGRGTTYVLLGVVAAMLSGLLFTPEAGHPLPIAMLVIAAILFIWMALPDAWKPNLTLPKGRVGHYIGRGLAPLARPFQAQKTAFHQYMMGVLLGFIPCGMLYAALMAVAASANVMVGALGMLAFVVGTMPSLLLIAFGQKTILGRWPAALQLSSRFAMTFNAFILFGMAERMVL